MIPTVKPLPISVTMISGAEERRIGRALESVAGWVSEIIVVMNEEVNDATENIARKAGAKVFREPWKGYVGQVNSALEKASQPWILCIDADEAVSPELKDEIIALFQFSQKVSDVSAYSFPRCSFYFGRWIRHGDWYPDRKIRLVQRGKGRWGGDNPHNALRVDGPVGRLDGDLFHYSMETVNHQVFKTVKYADLFAEQALKKNQRVGLFDLAVRPAWRFIRGYFFRLGFLDGWQGLAVAWMCAFSTFLRYLRVREDQAAAKTSS